MPSISIELVQCKYYSLLHFKVGLNFRVDKQHPSDYNVTKYSKSINNQTLLVSKNVKIMMATYHNTKVFLLIKVRESAMHYFFHSISFVFCSNIFYKHVFVYVLSINIENKWFKNYNGPTCWECRAWDLCQERLKFKTFSQKSRGYPKNHCTNTRLVCTHFNAFFHFNPIMAIEIMILKCCFSTLT